MTSITDLVNMAAEEEDQTVTPEQGDFEYKIPEAGITVGRFIEYIELGKQPQRAYKGEAKPPYDEVRLTFELNHPDKNQKEIEVEGVGKKKIAEYISFKLTKKLGDKASYKQLFNKMARGRPEIKHMAQMLGEPFLLTVFHNESGEGDKKKVYANLHDGKDPKTWGIDGPFAVDALAGTKTDISSKIPAPLQPLRVFLWNHPTKDTWDSLYIDGTREAKDDKGNVTQVSKNWLQELILSAKNFGGSPLQIMINGVDNLSVTETKAAAVSEDKGQDASGVSMGEASSLPAEGTAESGQPAPATNAAAQPSSAVDALAGLGLTV